MIKLITIIPWNVYSITPVNLRYYKKTQHYVIYQLCKLILILYRKEITLEDKNLIPPKFAQIGRAHGLPKLHKDYQDIPPFRSIVDTTSTPHYGIGKYLSSLLNQFTINNYSIEDSFETAKRIKAIPPKLFNEGYKFISFDVTSLILS